MQSAVRPFMGGGGAMFTTFVAGRVSPQGASSPLRTHFVDAHVQCCAPLRGVGPSQGLGKFINEKSTHAHGTSQHSVICSPETQCVGDEITRLNVSYVSNPSGSPGIRLLVDYMGNLLKFWTHSCTTNITSVCPKSPSVAP